MHVAVFRPCNAHVQTKDCHWWRQFFCRENTEWADFAFILDKRQGSSNPRWRESLSLVRCVDSPEVDVNSGKKRIAACWARVSKQEHCVMPKRKASRSSGGVSSVAVFITHSHQDCFVSSIGATSVTSSVQKWQWKGQQPSFQVWVNTLTMALGRIQVSTVKPHKSFDIPCIPLSWSQMILPGFVEALELKTRHGLCLWCISIEKPRTCQSSLFCGPCSLSRLLKRQEPVLRWNWTQATHCANKTAPCDRKSTSEIRPDPNSEGAVHIMQMDNVIILWWTYHDAEQFKLRKLTDVSCQLCFWPNGTIFHWFPCTNENFIASNERSHFRKILVERQQQSETLIQDQK